MFIWTISDLIGLLFWGSVALFFLGVGAIIGFNIIQHKVKAWWRAWWWQP